MTEGDALLATICAEPSADTPRLIYADWLDEHEQPERAEFVRVQVKLAGLPPEKTYPDVLWSEHLNPTRHSELRQHERRLWVHYGRQWFDGSPLEKYDLTKDDRMKWERGFPVSIACTAADWLLVHEAVYWHPKQTVCSRCGDTGFVSFPEMDGITTQSCHQCQRDRIPRPFVATAQPITKVALTTWPGVQMLWPDSPFDYLDGDYRKPKYKVWPTIQFEVTAVDAPRWENFEHRVNPLVRSEELRHRFREAAARLEFIPLDEEVEYA